VGVRVLMDLHDTQETYDRVGSAMGRLGGTPRDSTKPSRQQVLSLLRGVVNS